MMKKIISFLIIWTLGFTDVYCQNDFIETKLLKKLLANYDKQALPIENGKPVNVKVDTFILYMKVNSYDMEITLQMYFRQRWSDFRLRYNETSGPVPKTISFKDSNLIWTPDTFFPNSIGTLNSKQNLLRPNEHIRIQPDGNVFYSFRLTVTANCPMDLQYFPFDRQYCEIELESYGYAADELKLEWRSENSVAISSDLATPMFALVNTKTKTKSVQLSTGLYSRLSFGVELQRSAGYHMLYWYMPTMLLVLVSFSNFWLDVQHILTRVLVALIPLIALCRFIVDWSVSIPKISYMKAIDFWWFWCVTFIVCNLIQIGLIDFFLRREMKPHGRDERESAECLRKRSSECGRLQSMKTSFKPRLANKINFWSGFLFPVTFLLMNIVYFSVYM